MPIIIELILKISNKTTLLKTFCEFSKKSKNIFSQTIIFAPSVVRNKGISIFQDIKKERHMIY